MGGGGVWSFYVLAGGWFAGWAIRVMLNCCWVVHMIRFLGWVAGGWLLAGSRPCIGTVPYVSQYPSARIGIPRIGWCGVAGVSYVVWCGLVSPVQISTLRKKVSLMQVFAMFLVQILGGHRAMYQCTSPHFNKYWLGISDLLNLSSTNIGWTTRQTESQTHRRMSKNCVLSVDSHILETRITVPELFQNFSPESFQ
jgi:hypothetical protein